MEPLTPEIVRQVLIESIVQCAQEGDISIPIGKIRGDLHVLDLGLDSLTVNEVAGIFQGKLLEKAGRGMSSAETDDVAGVLDDPNRETLTQVAAAICELLNRGK